jgi:integrase
LQGRILAEMSRNRVGIQGFEEDPFKGRVAQWTNEEAADRYGQTLKAVSGIADMKTTKETNASRRRTFLEYQEFLAKNPFGVTVGTATPEDVAAFIHLEWLPNHSGNCKTVLPQTGQPVASASAVRGVVKDISKSYTLLGFEGASNPARSKLVKSYRDGYGNLLHQQGVKVQRAKVFSEAKLNALVDYLTSKLAESEGMDKCLLAMDRAAVLYLWETLARGKECGAVRQDQIDADEGTVYPGWTKTIRHEPSARIELEVPGEGSRMSFLAAAGDLVRILIDHGHDVGETGYLFRAQTRNRNGFENGPITSSALRKRIQKRLQEAGLFDGETLHSFCRLAVQHAATELKFDVRKLVDLGGWKTYSSFRLYVEEIWKR